MTEVSIRPARHSDYKGLEEFGTDIHAGHDYLAVAFPQMLHANNHFPFVAETADGRVVGFVACQIIGDPDRLALTMGTRVLPAYQGRGVSAWMTEAVEDFLRREMGITRKLTVNRGTSRHDNYLANREAATWQQVYHCESYRGKSQIQQRKLSRGIKLKVQGMKEYKMNYRILGFQESVREIPRIRDAIIRVTPFALYPGPFSNDVMTVTDAALRNVLNVCDVITSPGKADAGISFVGLRMGNVERLVVAGIFYYGDSLPELVNHLTIGLGHLLGLFPEDDSWTLGLTAEFPLTVDRESVRLYLEHWFTEQSIENHRTDFSINLLQF